MKLMNYDAQTLIIQNVWSVSRETPATYTDNQYRIRCNFNKAEAYHETVFDFLLLELYQLQDWKKLNYNQMYQLIHIFTFYDYSKEI